MNWRNDPENAPRDGTVLFVLDPCWVGQPFCRYSIKTVQYEKWNPEEHDEIRSEGFVYGYDHEFSHHKTCDNFTHWCVAELPEEMV